MSEQKVIIDLSEYQNLKKHETYLLEQYRIKLKELEEAVKNNATLTIFESNLWGHVVTYTTNEEFEKRYGNLFLNNYHIIGFKIKKKKQ